MKHPILFTIIILAFFGCTTAQLQQTAAIAKPIAEAALVAAAAYYGVPPTDTTAALAAADALWGAAAQVQASQPAANGTSIAPVGQAIAQAIPPRTSTAQTAALLQRAATLIPAEK